MGLHRVFRSVILWLCLSFLVVMIPLKAGLMDQQPFPTAFATFDILPTMTSSRVVSNSSVADRSSRGSPEMNSEISNLSQDSASVATILKHFVNETVPYDRNQIIHPIGTMFRSQCTIVTSYFNVKSKFEPSMYRRWMRNILSLNDAMVIFTSPDYVATVQSLRTHAVNRTAIFPMHLEHTPMATMFSTAFWEDQFQKDREKSRHQSHQLFWIWLSKSWFTTQAIEHNFFNSSIFLWSDIGTFRGKSYNGRTLIKHPELVPRHAILQMAHTTPIPQQRMFDDNKRRFYHSGSHAVGYADTWLTFYRHFMETLQGFVDRNLFMGDDQVVLQSTCRQHPTLCAYVNKAEVTDNSYFGLRHVLHYGGNYTYWHPPPLTVAEQAQLQQKPKPSVSVV